MFIAKLKFGIPEGESVTLFLEQDGTIVDSEEYFQTIEEQTIFLLKRENEIRPFSGRLLEYGFFLITIRVRKKPAVI